MFQFVWIVAFLSTLILDVDLGLGVAVAFNLLIVLYRVQRYEYMYICTRIFSKN